MKGITPYLIAGIFVVAILIWYMGFMPSGSLYPGKQPNIQCTESGCTRTCDADFAVSRGSMAECNELRDAVMDNPEKLKDIRYYATFEELEGTIKNADTIELQYATSCSQFPDWLGRGGTSYGFDVAVITTENLCTTTTTTTQAVTTTYPATTTSLEAQPKSAIDSLIDSIVYLFSFEWLLN